MKTTCAVDVHKECLEVEIIEWDENDQIGLVYQQTLKGDTKYPGDPWDELALIIEPIQMTLIDAGYRTNDVYEFAINAYPFPVFPMFGRSGRSSVKFNVIERTKKTVCVYVDEYRAGKKLSDCRVYNMAALDFLNQKPSTEQIKSDRREAIKRLISRPTKEQLRLRDELIETLEAYLTVCETTDDLNVLNNWGGQGLWLGDARIIAMLGACGAKIYQKVLRGL